MLSQEKVRAKTTVKITTVGPRASTGLSGSKLRARWGKVSIKAKSKARVPITIKKAIKTTSQVRTRVKGF